MKSKMLIALSMAAALSETNMLYEPINLATENGYSPRKKKRYIPKSKNRRTKNKYCMR